MGHDFRGDSTEVMIDLLRLIAKELAVTNKLLLGQLQMLAEISNKESKMTDAITQAFADLDTEISTIGTDILEMVARLAATPPGPDANAIATQIEARVTALKGVADPLKAIAVAPAPVQAVPEPATPPAPVETPPSDTPTV